jgi:hypothetical protein
VQSWEVHGTTARRNQEHRQGEEEMGLLLHVLDVSRSMRSIIIVSDLLRTGNMVKPRLKMAPLLSLPFSCFFSLRLTLPA